MHLRSLLLSGLAGLASCGDGDPRRGELSVAGAASLRELLEASAPDFVALHGGDVALSFTFAGSSTLARQIAAGADVDVFVSADPRVLAHAGDRVSAADARVVLQNRLALVARPGAPVLAGPGELIDAPGSIAVAAPAVPAGRYARELLADLGLAESLAPRLVHADHVRAALALVESGAADYGLVYATDAALARRARTDWTAAAGAEPAIHYVAVGTRDAQPRELASAYVAFLAGETFAERARSLGFQVDP